MTENRNIGQDVPAEILKTVRRGQEAVVEAIKTWTDTVAAMTPPMPEVRVPFASRLPKPEELASRLPKPQELASRLPKPQEFASRLPKPQELIGNAYDLAEKLLAGQRKFAEDVLHATAALLPGSDGAAGNGEQTPGRKAAGKNGTAAGKSTGTAGKNTGTAGQKNGPSAG
jgi:hypothetical protein